LLLRAAIDALQMIPSNTCVGICSSERDSITLPHIPDIQENYALWKEIWKLSKGRDFFWCIGRRAELKDARKLAREVSGSIFRYDDNDQIDPPMLEPQ